MRINDMSNLYVATNWKEGFNVLVLAQDADEAKEIADTYGEQAKLEGEFIVDENADLKKIRLDCDYVISPIS